MLTGKEIAKSGMIQNYLEENIQQVGIDVRLKEIIKLEPETVNCVPREGKTHVGFVKEPYNLKSLGKITLESGYYEITFMEGCKIPKNGAMYYKTRSSLVRCGCSVHSGMFDPGFETEFMGAFLEVRFPITLEYGSRLAQVIIEECNTVENLYNGQWQNS